jgi:hypothetical protein
MLESMNWTSGAVVFFSCASLLLGCGGDDEPMGGDPDGGIRIDSGAGRTDSGGGIDSSSGSDSGGTGTDAGGGTDAGPTPDWARCTMPSECVLAADDCCGVCGAPELENLDAVNMARLAEHRMAVCTEPEPMCPDCPTALNPYLVATCRGMVCTGLDTRRETFSECEVDTDCRIRAPECCECGGSTGVNQVIAIATDGESAYSMAVCDSGTACPECAPVYDADAVARCVSGHCEVENVGR